MNSKNKQWVQWHRTFWAILVLSVMGLSLARWVLFYGHTPGLEEAFSTDVKKVFWLGLRFDVKNAAIFIGPWLLISLFFYSASSAVWRVFTRGFSAYAFVFLSVVNLLSVVNYYYFTFYQSPINALIFGLKEDDTQAVLQTLWSDFPVIRLLLLVFGFSAIQLGLARAWGRRGAAFYSTSGWVAMVVVSIFAVVLLGRGSVSKFPLRAMHMTVSSHAFLNQLVPSGLHALLLVRKERKRSQLGDDENVLIKAFGFENWQQAASQCLNAPIKDYAGLQQVLPVHSHAKESPPHVVLTIMEGWGRHLMEFDDPVANDLLGALRPWVQQKADYFGQAISIQHGTHPSLEGLLLDTPITPLTQSIYGYVNYDTARMLPYKKAGYRTVFLTAGPGSWRQLNTVLLKQGFDEVHDETAIRRAYPEASTHTWGVDDEWMFKYGFQLLQEAEARGEKVALVMLSVTNHPPHRIPSHYQPFSLDQNKLQAQAATSAVDTLAILQTYQYANHALGEFLNDLERSQLLSRTLFAATGDHNTRMIFSYPDNKNLHNKYGVPLLFYIPEAYRVPSDVVPARSWAGHSDIFPTLWAHSLSEVEVPLSQGHNLYQSEPLSVLGTMSEQGGDGVILSRFGAIANLSRPVFYEWADGGELEHTESPSTELQQVLVQQRSCFALSDWRIRSQALAVK